MNEADVKSAGSQFECDFDAQEKERKSSALVTTPKVQQKPTEKAENKSQEQNDATTNPPNVNKMTPLQTPRMSTSSNTAK